MEHVRNHAGFIKGIIAVGFLTGLVITCGTSAYSSYTGETEVKANAFALQQRRATVYYTKEPQRVLQWNSVPNSASVVGNRDSSPYYDGGHYANPLSNKGTTEISNISASTPLNSSSGKVHRVKFQNGFVTSPSKIDGANVTPYWTTSSGKMQRYLEAGKKYVLFCYARGKGTWQIGDEQADDYRNDQGNYTYLLNENTWTKIEHVFTADDGSTSFRAFVQYAHNGQAGDYCDVSDVFVAEVDKTVEKPALNPIGKAEPGSDILGFKGWASTPDKCGVGYGKSDADYSESDTVPVEGRVYYPVVRRCLIDFNALINGKGINDDSEIEGTSYNIPAHFSLTVNGAKIASSRYGDLFTSAPEGSTYSVTVDSVDSGLEYTGLSNDSHGLFVSESAEPWYLSTTMTSIKPGTYYEKCAPSLRGTLTDDFGFFFKFAKPVDVVYTKEPQRVLQWYCQNDTGGDLVGNRDGGKDSGDSLWGNGGSGEVSTITPGIASPIHDSGKVRRVKVTAAYSGRDADNNNGYVGQYCDLFWTISDGTTQRYLTPGKKYVLCCYAKGKGTWMIGSEQDDLNKNNKSNTRKYSLRENSWTRIEQVFTATSADTYKAFVQYAYHPSAGDYSDVTDVFVAEVDQTVKSHAGEEVGKAPASNALGFKGWTTEPDKCGVGYDADSANYHSTDTVGEEPSVYYPVISKYAIDVNAIIDDEMKDNSNTFVPANLTLKINGKAVASNRHGDIYTCAPEGSTYSLSVDSADAGYRYKGLAPEFAKFPMGPDAQSILQNYKFSVSKGGRVPTYVSSLSGTLTSDIALNLAFTDKYEITYDFNGGHARSGARYKTKYKEGDADYSPPIPEKDGMGFAGWTWENMTTGQKGTTNELNPEIYSSTGLGDIKLTAHWGSPIEVSCEDWTMDYNGNPYKKVSSYSQKYYIAEGTQVSSSMWENKASNSDYAIAKYETGKVSSTNHVFKKLCVLRDLKAFRSQRSKDGELLPINVTFEIQFSDKNGKVLYDSQKTLENTASWSLNDMFPQYNGHPDGYKMKFIRCNDPEDPDKVSQATSNYNRAMSKYEEDNDNYRRFIVHTQEKTAHYYDENKKYIIIIIDNGRQSVTINDKAVANIGYQGHNYRISYYPSYLPAELKSKYNLYVRIYEDRYRRIEDVIPEPVAPNRKDYFNNVYYTLRENASRGVGSWTDTSLVLAWG